MATAARTGVGGSSWGSVLRSDTSGAAHDLSKAVRRGGSRVARYKAAERVLAEHDRASHAGRHQDKARIALAKAQRMQRADIMSGLRRKKRVAALQAGVGPPIATRTTSYSSLTAAEETANSGPHGASATADSYLSSSDDDDDATATDQPQDYGWLYEGSDVKPRRASSASALGVAGGKSGAGAGSGSSPEATERQTRAKREAAQSRAAFTSLVARINCSSHPYPAANLIPCVAFHVALARSTAANGLAVPLVPTLVAELPIGGALPRVHWIHSDTDGGHVSHEAFVTQHQLHEHIPAIMSAMVTHDKPLSRQPVAVMKSAERLPTSYGCANTSELLMTPQEVTAQLLKLAQFLRPQDANTGADADADADASAAMQVPKQVAADHAKRLGGRPRTVVIQRFCVSGSGHARVLRSMYSAKLKGASQVHMLSHPDHYPGLQEAHSGARGGTSRRSSAAATATATATAAWVVDTKRAASCSVESFSTPVMFRPQRILTTKLARAVEAHFGVQLRDMAVDWIERGTTWAVLQVKAFYVSEVTSRTHAHRRRRLLATVSGQQQAHSTRKAQAASNAPRRVQSADSARAAAAAAGKPRVHRLATESSRARDQSRRRSSALLDRVRSMSAFPTRAERDAAADYARFEVLQSSPRDQRRRSSSELGVNMFGERGNGRVPKAMAQSRSLLGLLQPEAAEGDDNDDDHDANLQHGVGQPASRSVNFRPYARDRSEKFAATTTDASTAKTAEWYKHLSTTTGGRGAKQAQPRHGAARSRRRGHGGEKRRQQVQQQRGAGYQGASRAGHAQIDADAAWRSVSPRAAARATAFVSDMFGGHVPSPRAEEPEEEVAGADGSTEHVPGSPKKPGVGPAGPRSLLARLAAEAQAGGECGAVVAALNPAGVVPEDITAAARNNNEAGQADAAEPSPRATVKEIHARGTKRAFRTAQSIFAAFEEMVTSDTHYRGDGNADVPGEGGPTEASEAAVAEEDSVLLEYSDSDGDDGAAQAAGSSATQSQHKAGTTRRTRSRRWKTRTVRRVRDDEDRDKKRWRAPRGSMNVDEAQASDEPRVRRRPVAPPPEPEPEPARPSPQRNATRVSPVTVPTFVLMAQPKGKYKQRLQRAKKRGSPAAKRGTKATTKARSKGKPAAQKAQRGIRGQRSPARNRSQRASVPPAPPAQATRGTRTSTLASPTQHAASHPRQPQQQQQQQQQQLSRPRVNVSLQAPRGAARSTGPSSTGSIGDSPLLTLPAPTSSLASGEDSGAMWLLGSDDRAMLQ